LNAGKVSQLGFIKGAIRFTFVSNVRRYVALVRQLADGGAPCPAQNVERSGCFCTRGAMQGYDGYYFILALAKTPDELGQAVTPGGGPWREPGQAAPPTT
jgi:hypothetical protein